MCCHVRRDGCRLVEISVARYCRLRAMGDGDHRHAAPGWAGRLYRGGQRWTGRTRGRLIMILDGLMFRHLFGERTYSPLAASDLAVGEAILFLCSRVGGLSCGVTRTWADVHAFSHFGYHSVTHVSSLNITLFKLLFHQTAHCVGNLCVVVETVH